jgi:hypothetical protein
LQIDETSLTHCESHFVVQQYESCEQMTPAHESHVFVIFVPVEQMECEQLLPPPPPPPPPPEQLSPQIEPTSPTQIESHDVEQQYESDAQTC